MTSNKLLKELLERVARGDVETGGGARTALSKPFEPSRSRTSGSRKSTTIARYGRASRRSSSALGRRPLRLPPSRTRSSAAARRCSSRAPRREAFDAVRGVVPAAVYHAEAAIITLRQQDVTPRQRHDRRRLRRDRRSPRRGGSRDHRRADGQ